MLYATYVLLSSVCAVWGVLPDLCVQFMYFRVCVHMCMHVRVNVCAMEQMVFRPLCAIEKSPYVFAGLTKCKHTMLQWEKNTDMVGDVSADQEQICLQHFSAVLYHHSLTLTILYIQSIYDIRARKCHN